MDEAEALATHAAKSGLCSVRDPSQALVVLLTGMELGLSPMQSFRGIHVVSGKPVLSADLLVGIVRASTICQSWQTLESTPDRCTIETHRLGDATPTRKTWTAEDAKRARLSTQAWGSYPAQMLRHRCSADLAREVYPDLAMGLYTPDEVSEGRVADVGAATLVRDEAPAQPASPDRLLAFTADLLEAEDISGVRAVFGAHSDALGGTSAKPVADAVVGHLATRGYHLNASEARAICGSTLDLSLALAFDRLAAVDRHVDDEEGDGVVADVVRVLRGCGAMPKLLKTRVMGVAVATVGALGVDDAKARITAALAPPPPPPTRGNDAPTADAVAAAQTTNATTRLVLDSDTSHIPPLNGTWRETEAGWRDHLAEMTVRRRIESSVACNGAALGAGFVALAAERIVAIDGERPRPEGVARLTLIGVTQTLERVALDASRERAALAQAA